MVMPRISCCKRQSPECTARKQEDDYTAICPVWGVVAVQIYLRGRRPKTIMVKGNLHLSHWLVVATGLKGRAKTKYVKLWHREQRNHGRHTRNDVSGVTPLPHKQEMAC